MSGLTRDDVLTIINEVFRFGEIKSSKVGASKSVQLGVTASDDEESSDDCDTFGQAPLQFKPPAGLECMFMQRGDEKIVLSIKTREWSIAITDGEVVLQALGSLTPAYLHLKPGGDATLKGANITIDMTGETKIGLAASQFPALDNLVTAQLNTLKTAISSAPVVAMDGGAAFKTALVASLASWPTTMAATKTKVL